MRYYLDTNVLVAMLEKRVDDLNHTTREILADYGNIFYVSSEAVHELIHLLHVERINSPKHERVTASEVLDWLDKCGFITVFVNRTHLQSYSGLPVIGNHTDPADRLIISQAITDCVPLVSSDLRFPQYEALGLKHIPSR